jgi:hypothetical protein
LVSAIRGTVCFAEAVAQAQDALFFAKVRAAVLAEMLSPCIVFQFRHRDHSMELSAESRGCERSSCKTRRGSTLIPLIHHFIAMHDRKNVRNKVRAVGI